ncbi:MAG: 3-phosphoserine/phosphohydroxythreonine transaminase [Myxococcota bacterium]|nr:3-phosphoserine/phosphohydroxythreonine transaminase [Myxococcota bacterium]MDW8361942.1 3-phosphoserine/phosphohydroxythreonine transaminase [Myxococcales bacterium]
MSRRAINFNAGPAALPLPALERARDELLDIGGTGMSILEHSHRGKTYEAVHDEALSLARSLLGVPDTHEVLLLQGGASQQFAMVPMNLMAGRRADYVLTGAWGEKAYAEARIVGETRLACSTKNEAGSYTRVPRAGEWSVDPQAAYVHITTNETIHGVQWHALPETGPVPLVCDASSDVLSRPIDVSRIGLLYAGAQKNLGPAGVVLVVVRKDLLARCPGSVPVIFRYATHAEHRSLYNTAPTFGIYLLRNVLAWVAAEGGAEGMARRNVRKAEALYGVIDEHAGFYRCPIERDSRSWMNVVFRLPDEKLEAQFIAQAREQADIVGLQGHRSVGGIRVSMYNAIEPAQVDVLVDFMRQFVRRHG